VPRILEKAPRPPPLRVDAMEHSSQLSKRFLVSWVARAPLMTLAVLLACCTNDPQLTLGVCDGGLCAGRPEDAGGGCPLPPPPTVVLTGDGFTNLTEPPEISVDTIDPIDPGALEQLARDAHVLDESTSAAVETEAEIFGGSPAHGIDPTIRLFAKQPLEDGWYILEVAAVHAPLRWPEDASFRIDHGAGRVRFRAGSDPRVLSVRACEKAGGLTKLELITSEKVVVMEPVRDHLTVESKNEPLECDWTLSDGGLSTICDLTGVDSVKLIMNEAFASLSSPSSPAEAATAEFEFSLNALPTVAQCKRFEPE
jgi:hypothetical protein